VLEGYLLYNALVVIFDNGDRRLLPYYLFGYGVPGAIVILTIIVAVIGGSNTNGPNYHSDEMCWLDHNYIWFFTGPVIVVLLFNTVILFRGLRIAIRVRFPF
jgi:hypothetical protein